jgi:hypothetical protein
VAGSGDVENDPGTDNFGQIQTDVDSQYGKGMYTKLVHNLGNMRPDGKGNMVLMKPPEEDYVPDPNKPDPNQGWTPVTDKNGVNTYSLPIQDANRQDRIRLTRSSMVVSWSCAVCRMAPGHLARMVRSGRNFVNRQEPRVPGI